MKAKEYAQVLIEVASAQDENERWNNMAATLKLVILETHQLIKARHCKTSAQMAGCVRESFNKWKSIVATVLKAVPDYPIQNETYPIILLDVTPELYVIALENNGLLGHKPSKDELDLVKATKNKHELNLIKTRARSLARSLHLDYAQEQMLVDGAVATRTLGGSLV